MIFFLIILLIGLKIRICKYFEEYFPRLSKSYKRFSYFMVSPKMCSCPASVFLAKLLAACTTFVFEKMHLNVRKATITNFVVNIIHFCHSRRS